MKPVAQVVDDDASFLQALRRLLTASGHVVAAFASVADFLARRDPAARGCVVVDLRMPGHSTPSHASADATHARVWSALRMASRCSLP